MQRGDAPRQSRPPPPQPGYLPTWGGAAPGAAHCERQQQQRQLCGPALAGLLPPRSRTLFPSESPAAAALGRVSNPTRHPHPALPPARGRPRLPRIPEGARAGRRCWGAPGAPNSAAPPRFPRPLPPPLTTAPPGGSPSPAPPLGPGPAPTPGTMPEGAPEGARLCFEGAGNRTGSNSHLHQGSRPRVMQKQETRSFSWRKRNYPLQLRPVYQT